MEGTIIKAISGFYYVKTDYEIIECKARGKFRYTELTPMVGDKVEISTNYNKGVIEKVFKRHSELIRPVVANITQAFVIFSLKNPDLNLDLLNKFLLLCEFNNLKAIVCFNKLDLVSVEEKKEAIDMVGSAGYELLFLKAKEGYGLQVIKEKLTDNLSVFCGPSGVGKSTILNNIVGREVMITGEISTKVGRGKHTTRHSELIDVENGFVVDTPGFSSLDLNFIPKEKIQYCFPEFLDYINDCRFTGCLHYKEPNCAIKEAVSQNIINIKRYEFYVKTLEETFDRRNNK